MPTLSASISASTATTILSRLSNATPIQSIVMTPIPKGGKHLFLKWKVRILVLSELADISQVRIRWNSPAMSMHVPANSIVITYHDRTLM
jgi:hypothetical protein